MQSNKLITELIEYAQRRVPLEMCGLLFPDGFHQAWNSALNPTREFTLAIEHYLDICSVHVEKPWALVHSHPGKGASPSVKDCQLMDALQIAKQDLAMVIVGLQPVEIRVFKKDGDLYRLVWSWAREPADADELVKT